MKHTPGPWVYINLDGENGGIGGLINTLPESDDHRAIADLWRRNEGTTMSEEDEANAHLIAAAPDMYEALKAATSVLKAAKYGQSHIPRDVITWAVDALAKAEGR